MQAACYKSSLQMMFFGIRWHSVNAQLRPANAEPHASAWGLIEW
jgi:hypothetical protein